MPTMQRLPNLPPSEIGMASGNSSNTSVVDKTITRVDGKGLWRSWKRNFKNKLLAVLDLVDNSLDASIQAQQAGEQSNFIGRCHIYPDVYDELGLGVSSETTTGIVIVNNCTGPIRSLKHALEVYDSSKVASGAGQVGENGVGLKQACATMSDLSFVLTKNESTCELGIIAESLQRVEGCYLPAFTFSSVNQIGIEIVTWLSVLRCMELPRVEGFLTSVLGSIASPIILTRFATSMGTTMCLRSSSTRLGMVIPMPPLNLLWMESKRLVLRVS
mmetsp:Transcript_12300/g.26863  ORF Transcript_12300/g.26863 Transcript_12300/m.26863 type:complete len:273 (-) Transcript_12300:2229-3047(-)